MGFQILINAAFGSKPGDDAFYHLFGFNLNLIEPLIERTFREKICVTTFAILFEIFEVQSSVFADFLLFGELKQGIVLLTSEFVGNSVLFNVLFHLIAPSFPVVH